MSGPTLFRPGNLEEVRDRSNSELVYTLSQEQLDKIKPVDHIMNWFEKSWGRSESPADRILVVHASTGSGKSTVLPPEVFHRFFLTFGKRNICCTQPRVLTAIEITNTVAPHQTREALLKAGYHSRDPLVIGRNLGYQTGVVKKRPSRGVIYMTVGVLTQQLSIMSDEEFLSLYSVIFLDEVHERSLDTDYALYALKKFIQRNYRNRNCPFLVIMSATFDLWRFTDYLLSDVAEGRRYQNIVKVKGSTFPVREHFLDYDSGNYLQHTVDTVAQIHKSGLKEIGLRGRSGSGKKKLQWMEDQKKEEDQYRDILVFVWGMSDIRKIKKKLVDLNSRDPFFQKNPVLPVELTGDVVQRQAQEGGQLFDDLSKQRVEVLVKEPGGRARLELRQPTRRVFIATNVAETGVTIHTLRYVVDTGWFKSSEFNPQFDTRSFVIKPVAKSMHTQRRGRVGRESPGEAWFLYTKRVQEEMILEQFPDIIKDDITLNLLSFLVSEVDPRNETAGRSLLETSRDTELKNRLQNAEVDVTKLDLLDLPSADSLHYGLEKLFLLGAIGENTVPTSLGLAINRFRFLSLENIKMILAGYAWGVAIQDLITMACMVQLELRNVVPDELKKHYQAAVQEGSFGGVGGQFLLADDWISSLLVFNEFQKVAGELQIGTEKVKENIPNYLQEWTEALGLSVTGLHKVVDLREEVIAILALIGFNPYQNFEQRLLAEELQEPHTALPKIRLLKQCLFEGFKDNLAIWNPGAKRYFSRKTHLPLEIPELAAGDTIKGYLGLARFGDSNPRYIIYDQLRCERGQDGLVYVVGVGALSVLDGFLPIDVNFDTLV